MKERGFTLVEGLVGGLLLALSASLITRCVTEGRKREARVDARLDALRAVTLAFSHLRHDFAQVVPIRGYGLKAQKDSDGVVFFRSARVLPAPDLPAVGADLTPVWQRVTYRFDHERHHLLRDGTSLGTYRNVALAFDPGSEEGYTLAVDVDAGQGERSTARPGVASQHLHLAYHSPLGTRALVHQDSMP
jgi:type II secretory pathway pseudopilin PulG